MEILYRFRNLTALLGVLLTQLILLGYQIKSNGEVRLIRVWALGAVTPLARVIEATRTKTAHFIDDYILLARASAENRRIKAALDQQQLENQRLRTELATADRAHALAIFEQQSPSKTIAARVIGNATGIGTRVVILDRGSSSGIEKGMAVITAQGIVGKITGVYANAAYVLLLTDSSFAAGVISQKARVRGTLRGEGDAAPAVELISNDLKIEKGDWFYTSGDDRIFPKGLPVGQVTSVGPGRVYQEIQLLPSGLESGLEEVLVVVDGVHGRIPDAPPPEQSVRLLAPPPTDTLAAPADSNANAKKGGGLLTDADRMLDRYRKIGLSLGHVFGQSGGAPNYNINLNPAPATAPREASSAQDAPPPSPLGAVKP